MYQQVAARLRARIESGELRPGETLPAVRALMQEYGVAGSTVQKALRAMQAEGLLESTPRKGLTVRDTTRLISRSAEFVSPVPEGGKTPHGRSTSVEVSEVVASADVTALLGVDAGEPVVRRGRMMLDDEGQIVEITASYFPKSIADGTPLATGSKLGGATPTALKRLGYPPRSPAREWVDARMPTAEEARILRMPPGAPVFRMLRLTKTDGGKPVEVLEMILPGHLYRLEYDLPIHE